jgi:hypothetical protein
MTKHIKIILAVGIFICMFLPLSKCSSDLSGPRKQSENLKINNSSAAASTNIRQDRVTRIADRMPNSIMDYVATFSFVLPLLFCLPFPKNKKLHLTQLLLQILFSIWLLIQVYILVYSFYTPLYGGYILTLLAVTFFIHGLFELFNYIRCGRNRVGDNTELVS